MQIIQEIPSELFETIHESALKSLTRHNSAYNVGMHTARMNINGTIKKTIIPPLRLFISRITSEGVVSSQIDYRVTYNNQTFPLGHVYGASGYLCLGNIPVPPFVKPTDLMTPLEILFLYNDRVLHGSPKLNISEQQHKALVTWAMKHNIAINATRHEYIKKDVLWDIGARLLQMYDIETAYEQADIMFKITFKYEESIEV